MNRWALVQEAEAYLDSIQCGGWEVYRNGPGAARVRVHRAGSESEAREFVDHIRRAHIALRQSKLSFWRTPPPVTVYTVERRMSEEESPV